MTDIDEDVLQDLYAWVDQIQLSRPKKNIVRDFADGVLMAEVVHHYFPRFVDVHNYPACHNTSQKKKNWQTLNWKAFKKLNFELSNDVIDSIINCKPGTIERVLLLLRSKIDQHMSARSSNRDDPEVDQQQSRHKQQITVSPRAAAPYKIAGGTSSRAPPPVVGGSGASQGMKKGGSLQHLGEGQMVPRIAYEEKVQECLAKDETIEILQAKIRRLEHLLHLKDVRIDDLAHRMEEVRPTGLNNPDQMGMGKKAMLPRIH